MGTHLESPKGMNSPSTSKPEDTDDEPKINCFSQVVDDVVLHFQIVRLQKQIYAWIGCNSAKFGHLYAAAPTRPSNAISITSLIGGAADKAGSSIARRLVLKTGLNVVLACNIPKNSPMLEANAEKILMAKLINLGYVRLKTGG